MASSAAAGIGSERARIELVDQRVGLDALDHGADDPVSVDGDRDRLGDVDVVAVRDRLDPEHLDRAAPLVAVEQEGQLLRGREIGLLLLRVGADGGDRDARLAQAVVPGRERLDRLLALAPGSAGEGRGAEEQDHGGLLGHPAPQVEEVPIGGAQPDRRNRVARRQLHAHAPIVARPRRTAPRRPMNEPVGLEGGDDPLPALSIERRTDAPGVGRDDGAQRPLIERMPLRLRQQAQDGAPVRSIRSAQRGLAGDGDSAGRAARGAAARDRAGVASRVARSADGRAELHRGVGPGGDVRAEARSGEGIGHGLQPARLVGAAEAAQQPAPHVRVDHAGRHAERERGDGPRRVRADAGQGRQAGDVARPAVAAHDRGGTLERERATVVAQPAPLRQHVGARRRRE